ncbi:MAG: insulinase family protein [Planctomycetaceae bacterium]|nr:insulinase family protein [Planctomycetaceae bacterium]
MKNFPFTLITITAALLMMNIIVSENNGQTNTTQEQDPQVVNWQLEWSEKIDELKATARMYRHTKTAAPLLYLSCEDDNKVFCISFRTPPEDDTGIAHIMEHSVLCGSKKFPTKEPFVDLLKGSLQTFLNAFTADDRTMYPVASRNENDFHNLMNVYLDAVFFPNLITTPETLMQEGWHYEIDEDGNLKYNGVVYNEMKGVYSSPQSVLYRTIQKLMYADSTYTNDSGGNPDSIPKLTQEMFNKFHETYYHPSNSMIFLYGNGDIKKHLEFIDKEYLQQFGKKDVNPQVITQPVFTQPKDFTVEYSVDDGDSTTDKTYLSMSYLLPPALDNAELSAGMDLLAYILVGAEAAPLKRALLDNGIGKDINCSFDSSILQPCFTIVATNAEPEMKQQFLEIIDTVLKELVEKGIDRRLIEGVINRTEFALREFQSGGMPKGLILAMNSLETWTYGGDPLRNLRFEKLIKNIRDGVDKNFFEELIKKQLLGNPSRGFLMLKPKQGLEKENSEKLTAKLAEIQKSFTPEQLEETKRKKAYLLERQQAPDTPENLAKIPVLSIEDIDRNIEIVPFTEDGRFLNADVDTNKIVYVKLYFDVHPLLVNLAKEPDLPAELSLLSTILSRVDTEHYTYGDFDSETNIHTGGIDTSFGTASLKQPVNDETFRAIFTVSAKVMTPKLEKGLELMLEIMRHSKFDDLSRLKEIIQEERVNMEQSLIASGHNFARIRAAAYFSPVSAFGDKTGGIGYYEYLCKLDKEFDERGKEIAACLKQLCEKLFVMSGNSFILVTLPKEEFVQIKPVFSKLDVLNGTAQPTRQAVVEKVLGQENEAVVIPSRVQYVAKAANYKKDGFEYSGTMLVLMNILRTGYLWNNIRVQGGAYGSGVSFDRAGIFGMWSYRDPNLKRTVEVYDGVADYLERIEITKQELTNSVISTIGSLDKPMTPSAKGSLVATMKIRGLTFEDGQRERDEVLATTQEDLRRFAPLFRNGMKQNNICVFGNVKVLDENKEMFKKTIRPIE